MNQLTKSVYWIVTLLLLIAKHLIFELHVGCYQLFTNYRLPFLCLPLFISVILKQSKLGSFIVGQFICTADHSFQYKM